MTSRRFGSRREGEAGQAIVVMLGAILVTVAMVATIVDGGNVFANQRVTQNGADATAEAGAVILAERLAGVAEPSGGWDLNVWNRLQQSAAANNITIAAAYYTDICGIPLQADGTGAINLDRTEDLPSALQVNNPTHVLPGGTSTAPDCPNRRVGPVAGVLVIGQQQVATFVARAIAIDSIEVTTRAVAVAGYLQGYCDASQGVWCAVLPVTIPTFVPECDNQGNLGGSAQWDTGVIYTIGLCRNDPGNIGWLDWDPPGGGASELTCSIVNPDNPTIELPQWMYVSQTGNTNGGGPCTDDDTGVVYSGVEDAIRKYDGEVVLIPQFSAPTCNPGHNASPNPNQVETPNNYGCAPADQGGSGQNQWYRITSFAFLQLCEPSMSGCNGHHGAYIQGNNSAVCQQGNGQTGCLIGRLVDIMGTGTVGPSSGSGTGTKALGVQLIR
ncbi:MAG TPA: Tad domain-containing protein [Candidatus Limnocylindrales bacterium]|nr:Tad domain-containing protein [Candidatus Limnocylindrales bacterium]